MEILCNMVVAHDVTAIKYSVFLIYFVTFKINTYIITSHILIFFEEHQNAYKNQ